VQHGLGGARRGHDDVRVLDGGVRVGHRDDGEPQLLARLAREVRTAVFGPAPHPRVAEREAGMQRA